MPRQRLNLIGQKFNRWIVIAAAGIEKNGHHSLWLCRCECGNIKDIPCNDLKRGKTKSCGCLRDERSSQRMKENNPRKLLELTGQKFGQLSVIRQTGKDKHNNFLWECRCECGNIKEVSGYRLVSGMKSCGCVHTTHGHCSYKDGINRRTPIYHTWYSMKQRCLNPNKENYKYYGERGITVCDRWLESFENFLEDMEATWKPGLSIDRKDVNGNYEPTNCKWSTPIEQLNNRRR